MVGLAALTGASVARHDAAERAMGTGLKDASRDRGVAQLHDVGGHSLDVDSLVRRIEALLAQPAPG
jgi:hypothetical protein